MSNKMDNMKNFDNILEECLERVLKGEDINACLERYPEYADELKPLLETALGTRDAAAISPRPEFRQRAALEFQEAIRKMPVKAKAAPLGFRSVWFAPLAALFLIIMAGTGTLFAASQSLPDSPLYRVKLATESIQLALTPSDLGKTELYAKFNDKRVAEIVAMAEKGDAGQIDMLTADLSSNMLAMADLTGGGAPEKANGDINMLMGAASMSEDAAESYAATTTTAVMTTTTAAPTMTAAPQPTVVSPRAPQMTTEPTVTATTAPPPAATTPTTVVPGTSAPPPPAATTIVTVPPEEFGTTPLREDGAPSGKEGELLQLLSEKQIDALNDLYEALEKAPEWLKPSIQSAIDVILSGYSVSISNLSF